MFAASLVISPALGTFILEQYPKTGMFNVVSLATGIAIMNLLFIIFIVPESLREGTRKSTWGNSITWEQADPFAVSLYVMKYSSLYLFKTLQNGLSYVINEVTVIQRNFIFCDLQKC